MGTSEFMCKTWLQQADIRPQRELEGTDSSQGVERLGQKVSTLILHEKCLLEKWPLAKIRVWVGFEAGG